MNKVDGAEGTGILRQLLEQAVNPASGVKEPDFSQEPEEGAGMQGPMALRRERLAEALREDGFVDIQASSAAKMKAFLKHAPSKPEEVEVDVDAATASELAMHMGAEVTGDVNLVLRILSRIDPGRVATLLK